MVATASKNHSRSAELIAIYQCLCDETRLRILNLLLHAGPLCVCHFQGLLEKPQVQISKHLAYLKAKRLVEAAKCANWVVYSLPAHRSAELELNLRCLEECVQSHAIFRQDLRKLKATRAKLVLPTSAREECK